ncbi:hypothetical protein EC991_008465 [Linnemannia zychae]|nr:hypothetical protein EC991_008465 [Linnemannia zychae]
MSQFLSLANDHDVRLHEDIQTRSCAACGTIFVPGVNSKVRVVPVAETRAEREKRKRAARRKAKLDKMKLESGSRLGQDVDMGAAPITDAGSTGAAQPTVPTTTTTKLTPKSSQPLKKIIRITPHTEIAQQQQHQQNQQRMNIRHGSTANTQKVDKHASQILNHIIYSCRRCDRITELPGTKEGFLKTRVKVTKPVSHHRKLKAIQKQQQEEAAVTVATSTSTAARTTSTNPSTPAPLSGLQPLNTIASAKSSPKLPSTPINNNPNAKRLASSHISPSPTAAGQQDPKRAKYSVSLPATPTTGLSRATSAASSAATSPASSPRPFGLDDKRPGGGNNKKKKKAGLANLLASQKPKDSDAGAGGSAGGGDSVLANFLMGL